MEATVDNIEMVDRDYDVYRHGDIHIRKIRFSEVTAKVIGKLYDRAVTKLTKALNKVDEQIMNTRVKYQDIGEDDGITKKEEKIYKKFIKHVVLDSILNVLSTENFVDRQINKVNHKALLLKEAWEKNVAYMYDNATIIPRKGLKLDGDAREDMKNVLYDREDLPQEEPSYETEQENVSSNQEEVRDMEGKEVEKSGFNEDGTYHFSAMDIPPIYRMTPIDRRDAVVSPDRDEKESVVAEEATYQREEEETPINTSFDEKIDNASNLDDLREQLLNLTSMLTQQQQQSASIERKMKEAEEENQNTFRQVTQVVSDLKRQTEAESEHIARQKQNLDKLNQNTDALREMLAAATGPVMSAATSNDVRRGK